MFWHMDANKPEKMDGEVDMVRWLTVEEAIKILDYEDEIELIQNIPIEEKKEPDLCIKS